MDRQVQGVLGGNLFGEKIAEKSEVSKFAQLKKQWEKTWSKLIGDDIPPMKFRRGTQNSLVCKGGTVQENIMFGISYNVNGS